MATVRARWGCPATKSHDPSVGTPTWRSPSLASPLSLLLVLALNVVVASCSGAQRAAQGTFTPKVAGRLVVGTELPAPGFWDGTDPENVQGGFEWALAGALAKELGLTLAVRSALFGDITRGALGDADLALAQVSSTPERRDQVDFSIAYMTSSPAILTATGATNVRDLATAKEQRWVVQAGTTSAEYLSKVVRPNLAPLIVDDQQGAVQMVLDHVADAALLDLLPALAVARSNFGLTVPARFDREEELAIVLPKGSSNTSAVNQGLRQLMAQGTLDELRQRWLGPTLAADPQTVPVIRTAG